MKCVKCGYADTSEANFCPICGNEVSNGRDEPEKGLVYEELIENNRSNSLMNSKFDYDKFFDKFASKKLKSNVKWLIICSFLSAAVSLPTTIMGNYLGFIDIVFFVVMAVLMMKKKNWICSLIITAYCIVFSVIALATSGVATGIIPIIFGIYSTKDLKKLKESFDSYVNTGILPETEI